MISENPISCRTALGRFGAIAVSAIAVTTILTATHAYAEKDQKNEGKEMNEGPGDDEAGKVKPPSAASVTPVVGKRKKHVKKQY